MVSVLQSWYVSPPLPSVSVPLLKVYAVLPVKVIALAAAPALRSTAVAEGHGAFMPGIVIWPLNKAVSGAMG